jgi:hypothetical protein
MSLSDIYNSSSWVCQDWQDDIVTGKRCAGFAREIYCEETLKGKL